MKLVLALGLLAVAFASTQWETRPEIVRDRVYRVGRQYTFKFDGQIASGLSVPSSQHAATRAQSIVSFFIESDYAIVMKLQESRVGVANSDLVEPRDVQPWELFEETEMTKEQRETLALPVRFRYFDGLVSDIEFDREEQPWSKNIKKAVLNMVNVNIAKKTRTDQAEMYLLRQESEESVENFKTDYFTTQELTLEGECETAYTVVPAKEEKIRISKSINFDKCSKRVDIRYNYRFGEECPSCEKKFMSEEKNTESTSVFDFELTTESDEFLIRKAEVKSQYVFTPLSAEQQMMTTVVANKLVLIKSDSTKIHGPKNTDPKESIVYSTEWEETLEKFRMTGDESLLKESPMAWMNKKVEIAKSIIKEIIRVLPVGEEKETEKTFSHETNHQIARLVEVLRLCTKEEINKIAHEANKEEAFRPFFFDALAIAGTKNTVEFLVEKIVEKEISPLKAARLMKELVDIRNPSEKIIDSLISLCKEDISERNPILRQSCWLTTGALLNGLCGNERKQDRFAVEISTESKKNMCPKNLKEKYVRELETLLKKAETRYEKILALKTFANSGIDLIVFPLEKIIKDSREERIVRVEAINALRKLRNVMPRKIHSILLPIFKNTKEVPEMRIAAYHIIMNTLPARSIIDQITAQLISEPSQQVYAFVYSSLKSVAKSDIPCEKDMARDIELSLRMARVQPRKTLDSHHIRATLFDSEYLSGSTLNWASIFSSDSVLPKELTASLDTVFKGQWNKYLAQVGVAQQNVDEVLYKLLRSLESESSMDEVVVRGRRATSEKPAEVLRKMMEKMGIQSRRHSQKDAHAMIYLRYKDLDYAILPIDEEVLPGLFKDVVKGGKIHLGELERVLAKGYRFDISLSTFDFETTRVIPTTFGLPLEITGKLPTTLAITGEIKAEFEPKNENSFDGLRLRLKAEPKIVSSYVHHQEVRSPFVSSGVKIVHSVYAGLPLDIELEMNWEKKFDIKTTVHVPEMREEKRVLSLSTRPVTYIRHESEEKKMISAMEKTIHITSLPTTEIATHYGEKLTGLRFNVRGNVHRHLLEKMEQGRVLPLFVCENYLDIVMEKREETPRKYIFTATVSPLESAKMIGEHLPEFESFYEKSNEEHFEVESSEYLEEEEKERRGAFDKYVKDYKKGSKSGYSGRVHLSLETSGSRVARRGEMEIRAMCEDSLDFCKWSVECQRSPLLEGERKQWKASVSGQTLFPETVLSLKQLKEQKHRELTAEINAKWGEEMENSLKIRLQGEQNKEQKKWQRLVQDKKNESFERLVLAARLNQIKIVADYKIVPETQLYIARVSALLKAWRPLTSTLIPRLSEKTFEREGRLLAKLSVEPENWRYVNLTVETPAEKLMVENIRLPFRPTFLSIHNTGIRSFTSAPMCEVNSKKVNTFDEVVFRAPLTTCYSVLAKDCSEQPKFAVLMKNLKKNGEEKKMKIVDSERIFEIEGEDFVVRVNGKVEKNEEKLAEMGLEKKGDVVIFKNDDIFVRFNGIKAEIKINELFKNKQCGLCGHYDGETEGEFRGADNKETDDLESFHRSFLARDDECEMEEEKMSEKKNYKKYSREEESEEMSRFESEEEESYEKEETIKPVKKTRVVEYSNRVCFSKEPVHECPRRSHPAELEEIKVKFSCVERSSSEGRRLIREARREGSVDVESLPHSFAETLRLPRSCTVY